MTKYIGSEKLKALLEQRKKQLAQRTNKEYANQRIDEIDCILDVDIDSLQQEQSEVDLDFKTFAQEMDFVFSLPKDMTENTEEAPLSWEYAIARHFYELGFNARKV